MAVRKSIIHYTNSRGEMAHHTYVKHEPSQGRLLVIYPGLNYSSDRPLLHLLRLAALQQSWDVLSLQYAFQATYSDPSNFTPADLAEETGQALGELLSGNKYLCLAGKSLGTAVVAAAFTSLQPQGLILLTPIPAAVTDYGNLPALAAIGTADPIYYDTAIQAAMKHDSSIQWMVLPGLNHALESPSDWRQSYQALGSVTNACADFLAKLVLSAG